MIATLDLHALAGKDVRIRLFDYQDVWQPWQCHRVTAVVDGSEQAVWVRDFSSFGCPCGKEYLIILEDGDGVYAEVVLLGAGSRGPAC